MNCKPGDLAVIVRGSNLGRMVEVRHQSIYGEGWWLVAVVGAPVIGSLGLSKRLLSFGSIEDARLRPIRNEPGNEDFVVKARKTLPRAKPVTGPVTIDSRGEVVR